jgi:hypothetical protein
VLAIVVLGTLGTGLTFHLNARLIADEGPTTAATVGYLLPVVSVALGAIVLDERLGARTIAGMAVVLVGVGLSRARPRCAAAGRPPVRTRHDPPPQQQAPAGRVPDGSPVPAGVTLAQPARTGRRP